tara:strand:+ start:688 stop:1731 length:1044 start_codon:yes stop_codon:yes gene_type:complete
MAKLLMKSLSADLPALAELIRSQGRGRDTILAHITPQEAALLKKRGGSGSMNPSTGLPEFQEEFGPTYQELGYTPPDIQVPEIDYGAYQGYTAPQENLNVNYGGFEGGGGGFFEPAPGMAQDIFQVQDQGYQPFSQLDAGGVYPGGGQAPPATMGIDRSQLEQPSSKSVMDRLGITEKDLPRLGLGALLTGGLTAQNLSRTRQAQQQAEASKEELAALGRPYQQTGAQLRGAAERGELSPVNRQILNAARAQLQQGVATRGGVGAAQAQNQIADLTQRLVQNQFDLGLRISNIGDQYIQGAIRSGLQADQAINAANQNFYSQLAQMAAPFILGQQPVYQVTTPVRRG